MGGKGRMMMSFSTTSSEESRKERRRGGGKGRRCEPTYSTNGLKAALK